jgi:hypothetical protein
MEMDGTLTNGPTFNSNGWFEFDGVDDLLLDMGYLMQIVILVF